MQLPAKVWEIDVVRNSMQFGKELFFHEVGLKPSKDGPLASLNKHLARDLI